MRIVSLLPSATEILFAIGAGDDLVGVTLECDYPEAARTRKIVANSRLEEGALTDLNPDVIVTQDPAVDDALAHLGCSAEVVILDPHSLEEMLASIRRLGEVAGRTVDAESLILDQRTRMLGVMRSVALRRRPRVAVLVWADPPYAPGHWIPEMVELAGGECVLGRPGEKSVRITWDNVRAANPDVVIVAPCGYDLAGAQALADEIVASDEIPGVPTYAVDANAYWTRPGPRLIEGVEALAQTLHFGRRPQLRDR